MKAAAAFAIVNFVWQGAAIGLIAWLGFAVSRSPRVRYFIGVAALALMAAAPCVTVALISQRAAVPGVAVNVQGSPEVELAATRSGGEALRHGTQSSGESGTATVASAWLSDRLSDPRVASMVLVVWLVGVAALSARLAFGWLGARRLTREIATAGAGVQAIANQLIAKLNIRATVRIVESALVKVPAVVGAFKPVVLLPAAAMSGLSMEQVEALLAHELAHVRRHDYLVNLLQSGLETLLFYHPAVWLISRRVRHERELCCDDLALAVCGDRVVYAAALADLESLRAAPSPVLAANGGANLTLAADGGSLLARVRRILGHDDVSALSGRSKSVAGVAILLSIVLVLFGQAARARGAQSFDDISKKIEPPPGVEKVYGPVKIGAAAQGGVQGGVQGGKPGGVKGGVPAGVKGGVHGGSPMEVSPEPSVAAVQTEQAKEIAPEVQQPAGPSVAVGQIVRLEVSVGQVRQAEFNKDYTVQPDGTIVVPYVGSVKAAGLSTAAIGSSIVSSLNTSNTLPGAKVAASIETREVPPPAPKAFAVMLQGAVRAPGKNVLREDRLTLSDAISNAGGFQTNAGSRIWVRGPNRPKPAADVQTDKNGEVFRKDDVLQGRVDVRVYDGDSIFVEVAPHFYVTGYVKNSSAEFNWQPGTTLQRAIEMAGGVHPDGATNRITIERKDPVTGKFVTTKLAEDKLATVIEPDDVIKVPKKRM